MVLKQLSDHAYGRSSKLQPELALGLRVMAQRLGSSTLRTVSAQTLRQWFMFADAAYEPDSFVRGLGAALFNEDCECVGWFGLPLDKEQCLRFGANNKQTIIYELEMLAAILGLDFWADKMKDGLQVCYGHNDGARFSLIRGSCLSSHASALMRYQGSVKQSTICALGTQECLPRQMSVISLPGMFLIHSCQNPSMSQQLHWRGSTIWSHCASAAMLILSGEVRQHGPCEKSVFSFCVVANLEDRRRS